jgi:hypothetical protein
MDIFLGMYDLPKLNQEDINKLNGSIKCNGIKALIKISQQRKLLKLNVFTEEYYQTLKEKHQCS